MKWIAATGLVSAFQCVFVVPVFERETHTPSGEFSAHSRASQPKLELFGGLRHEDVAEATDCATVLWLILAEELLGVFDEADDHHNGGAGHAHEEHDLKDVHCEQTCLEHEIYCIPDCETFPSLNFVLIGDSEMSAGGVAVKLLCPFEIEDRGGLLGRVCEREPAGEETGGALLNSAPCAGFHGGCSGRVR